MIERGGLVKGMTRDKAVLGSASIYSEIGRINSIYTNAVG